LYVHEFVNSASVEKKMSEEAAGNPAPDSGEEPGRESCAQQCRTHRNTSSKLLEETLCRTHRNKSSKLLEETL
jgi:hypothetical protein